MRKFKLLKDLPGCKAGAISELNYWEGSCYYLRFQNDFGRAHDIFIYENQTPDPEWFEEVFDWPKTWDEVRKDEPFDWDCRYFHNSFGLAVKDVNPSYKSIVARLKLEEIAALMNGNWKPDWKSKERKYLVQCRGVELVTSFFIKSRRLIVFKTEKMAEFSLKHHRDLWEDYYGIQN